MSWQVQRPAATAAILPESTMTENTKEHSLISTIAGRQSERQKLNNGAYPLSLNAFPACYRFRKLLQRQGVQFGLGFQLETHFRVVEVNSSQGQFFLTLVGPVRDRKTGLRKGNVCFEVKLPDDCVSEDLVNLEDLVGRMIRLNPDSIRDNALPIKQFRIDELQILKKGPIPNPFLFVDTRDLPRHILVPKGESVGILALNDLIDQLYEFCSLMNSRDNTFLGAVFMQRHHIKAFLTAPGSTNSHHSYQGGLLIHTLQVLRNTKLLVEKLPNSQSVDLSLAILCAFLHDIGKVLEYEPINAGAFQMSKIGLLLGHQSAALIILSFALTRYCRFDYERFLELTHCISAVPRDCVQSGNRARKTQIALLVGQADRLSAANKSVAGVRPEIGSDYKGLR